MKIEHRWLLMVVLMTIGFSLNGEWLWMGMALVFLGGWQLGQLIMHYIRLQNDK
jgi:hypothetical protein